MARCRIPAVVTALLVIELVTAACGAGGGQPAASPLSGSQLRGMAEATLPGVMQSLRAAGAAALYPQDVQVGTPIPEFRLRKPATADDVWDSIVDVPYQYVVPIVSGRELVAEYELLPDYGVGSMGGSPGQMTDSVTAGFARANSLLRRALGPSYEVRLVPGIWTAAIGHNSDGKLAVVFFIFTGGDSTGMSSEAAAWMNHAGNIPSFHAFTDAKAVADIGLVFQQKFAH